jgi:polysaccharide pyruvyl transferase WcaK-like protein
MALAPCDRFPGLKLLSSEGVPTDKNLVAFCLRKWKKVKRSEKILAALADKIADEFDLIPLFIPMQHPDDVRFLKKVMYHMTRPGYIMQKRYSVDQTLSILGNAKMVVGMRLHSLIYAAKLSIPMVGLAYEPKVNYFMQSINQPYVNWDRYFSMEDLMEKISNVWTNASRIRRELDEIKPVFEEKVKEAMELTLSLLPDE